MSCGCGKPKCDGKCGISPAVLQINNNECTLFRKVDVPASMGDSVTNPPKPGAYRNVLLYYQADETAYLYSSDGMFVKVTGSVSDYNTLINKPSINGVVLTGDRSLTALGITDAISSAVGDEAADRIAADNAIWDEIEIIEASSDVVDVVGTYADLQSYDTSKLHDNDLIKVLQDETHSDAITYYRWNKSAGTFSYVGEEGPYYTETEVNTLLSGKQDTLVAGSNIQIAADGKTISATDTTYSAGAGLDLTGTTFSVDTSVIAEVSDLPTKTSDLMNDGSDGTSTYVEADDLATVATTGDYDDLLNKPTVPTVNDATLTIQKNGTDVATFTANSATNTTANIAVPTNTSDLTNDSHFISYDDSTTCVDGKVLAISDAPANAPFASASIKGDTYQQTYTGKNLYPNSQDFGGNSWINSALWTTDSSTYDGLVVKKRKGTWNGLSEEISVESGKTYTFSVFIKADAARDVLIYLAKTGGASTSPDTKRVAVTTSWQRYSLTFTATSSGVIRARVENDTDNGSYTYICGYQLELSSQATSYEPYTNGPAPNPEYPQAIKTVTGENVVKVVGKNLLNASQINSDHGLTNTLNADGSITTTGIPDMNYAKIVRSIDITDQLEDGATYTLSASEHYSYIYAQISAPKKAGGTSYYGTASADITFTVDKSTYASYSVGVQTGTTANWGESSRTVTLSYQLEKGSPSTAFEKYQEQSYEVNLGKNLFGGDGILQGTWNSASSTSRVTMFIPCRVGDKYSFTNPNTTTYKFDMGVTTSTDQSANTQLTETGWVTTASYTYTCGYNGFFFIQVGSVSNAANSLTVEMAKGIAFQLEKGSATTYAPYFTPIELCKIGDYQDSIYKSGDKWYLRKEVGKATYNGSENWGYESQTYYLDGFDGKPYVSFDQNTPLAVSPHFRWGGGSSATYNFGDFWYTLAGTRLRLEKDENPNSTTLASFKTWLGSNNLSVYYVLATPTDTEITNEALVAQLNALASGYAYSPQTNIAAIRATGNEQAILSICVPVDTLPVATTSRLGTVVIGDGIDVDEAGRISVTPPDPTDYYWADVKVSGTSSTDTAPTFKQVKISGGNTFPHIGTNGTTLALSSGGWSASDGTIALGANTLRPANSKTTMDLGASSNKWRNIYMSGNIYTGSYTLTLPSATGTIALTSDIPGVFTGADAGTAGTSGIVPAPAAGDNTKFLAGDGTWKTVSIYSLPIASDTTLGGIKVGTNLTIDAGTGVLSATDTTYSNFVGATSGVAGSAGLVPAPTTSDPDKFLKGDGSWGTPPGTTYSAGTGIDITGSTIAVDTTTIAEVSDIPTKTSDLVNDGADNTSTYVEADELAAVATSGDYGDLLNKPSDRLYRELVPDGTAISSGSDLNTISFLKVDKYYCLRDSDASSMTHCPTTKAFNMEVFSPISTTIDNEATDTYVYRVRIITDRAGDMWVQQANSTTTAGTFYWQGWKKLYNGTVGDATLTIQKNGTAVQTFTANATSDATANITVPTTVAELTDASDYATVTQATYTAGDHIDITSNVITAEGYVHSEDPVSAVTPGQTLSGSNITNNSITFDKTAAGEFLQLQLTTVDPGEGSPLAANTLLGVYQ